MFQEITKRELTSQISRYLGNTTDDELWNNLLKVKVYFEEFNYENIEETPAYSVRRGMTGTYDGTYRKS